jgi:hypothetical protein
LTYEVRASRGCADALGVRANEARDPGKGRRIDEFVDRVNYDFSMSFDQN